MPASPQDTFVEHVLDSLAPLGPVAARRMFGGHGVYAGDLMFAIIANDMLYLKVDDDIRADFEAAGAGPFTYQSKGKTAAMSYYDTPADALDDPERLIEWARLALGAAQRARSARPKPRKRTSH